MCGRYTLHVQKQKLAQAIALALPDAYEPDYNLAPGSEVLSITKQPYYIYPKCTSACQSS